MATKLTDAQVRLILASDEPARLVADALDVCVETIRRIRRRESRAGLTGRTAEEIKSDAVASKERMLAMMQGADLTPLTPEEKEAFDRAHGIKPAMREKTPWEIENEAREKELLEKMFGKKEEAKSGAASPPVPRLLAGEIK